MFRACWWVSVYLCACVILCVFSFVIWQKAKTTDLLAWQPDVWTKRTQWNCRCVIVCVRTLSKQMTGHPFHLVETIFYRFVKRIALSLNHNHNHNRIAPLRFTIWYRMVHWKNWELNRWLNVTDWPNEFQSGRSDDFDLLIALNYSHLNSEQRFKAIVARVST